MNRRDFLKNTLIGATAMNISISAYAGDRYELPEGVAILALVFNDEFAVRDDAEFSIFYTNTMDESGGLIATDIYGDELKSKLDGKSEHNFAVYLDNPYLTITSQAPNFLYQSVQIKLDRGTNVQMIEVMPDRIY